MKEPKSKSLVSLSPSLSPEMRHACRLLAMIHELHKAGYQLLRIASGMAPSGCHWRCAIASLDNVLPNGWEPIDWDKTISYSTGDGDRYFGWPDAPGKSARQLAVMFLQRFPDLCRLGEGSDRLYSGWFVDVLGAAEQERLPAFYADHELTLDDTKMPPKISERLVPDAESAIKNSGGVAMRVVAAINGFRQKFGYWPSVIEAEAVTISDLATHSLTPKGFLLLQRRVRLVAGSQGRLLVVGQGEDVFDYGEEVSVNPVELTESTEDWLGWRTD